MKTLKEARLACWSFKEELGWPGWLKEVVVDVAEDGRYFLVPLVLCNGKEEEIAELLLRFVRDGFHRFEVEVKDLKDSW